MKLIKLIVVCTFVAGCSSTSTSVGSLTWHNERLAEIETAYANKEITKSEYLSLKNEADQVRTQRKSCNKDSDGYRFHFDNDGQYSGYSY